MEQLNHNFGTQRSVTVLSGSEWSLRTGKRTTRRSENRRKNVLFCGRCGGRSANAIHNARLLCCFSGVSVSHNAHETHSRETSPEHGEESKLDGRETEEKGILCLRPVDNHLKKTKKHLYILYNIYIFARWLSNIHPISVHGHLEGHEHVTLDHKTSQEHEEEHKGISSTSSGFINDSVSLCRPHQLIAQTLHFSALRPPNPHVYGYFFRLSCSHKSVWHLSAPRQYKQEFQTTRWR